MSFERSGGGLSNADACPGDAAAPNFKPFVQLIKEEKMSGNTEKALEAFLGSAPPAYAEGSEAPKTKQ